jgi:hypothetical protein
VWTAPPRTHTCVRLLKVPSVGKNKLLDVCHRILITRPSNRCSVFIIVSLTSYAKCRELSVRFVRSPQSILE